MDGLDDFHSVFGAEPNLAYHGQTIHEIHKHRHSLGNELFFDRLLRAIGIDKGTSSTERMRGDHSLSYVESFKTLSATLK